MRQFSFPDIRVLRKSLAARMLSWSLSNVLAEEDLLWVDLKEGFRSSSIRGLNALHDPAITTLDTTIAQLSPSIPSRLPYNYFLFFRSDLPALSSANSVCAKTDYLFLRETGEIQRRGGRMTIKPNWFSDSFSMFRVFLLACSMSPNSSYTPDTSSAKNWNPLNRFRA